MFTRKLQHFWKSAVNLKHSYDQARQIYLSPVFSKIVQFNLSDIGEGIAEVQVKEWLVKVGDRVEQFDNLCEVQSDKASVTITSRYDGVIKKLYYDVDGVAKVGKPLVDFEIEAEDTDEASGESSSSGSDDEIDDIVVVSTPSRAAKQLDSGDLRHALHQESSSSAHALATPAVRRIARENNITLSKIAGTGKGGRIMKEDMHAYLTGGSEGRFRQPSNDDHPGQTATDERGNLKMPRPQFVRVEDRTVPIKGYMRTMVKTMQQATSVPHFVYCDEITMDRLVDLRTQLKTIADQKGIRMSYMPLFIKAVSLALHRYPQMNSSISDSLDFITYKAAHNVSVAMDTPDGLIVPNIKHCEELSIWEIAAELNRLQDAGANAKFSPEDLKGGTISLSNIGVIGGTYTSPVLLSPQVCIGALGSIRVLPRYTADGELIPTHSINVSFAADHRIIDGATMARFVTEWKHYLEHPALMIAEMK